MKRSLRTAGLILLAGALFASLVPLRSSADIESAALPKDFLWGISWHPAGSKGGQEVARQLSDIGALNCRLVRFDARWSEIQPTNAPPDGERIESCRALAEEAARRGLKVKINLGGYPDWALALLRREPEEFFRRYRQYVREVVSALGETISYYQLGNEFNTILDPIPAELDARVFREARAEIDLVKVRYPNWKVKTVVNVCDSFYLPWKRTLEKALDEASSSIDVIGYDYYPGNYSSFLDWSAWPEIAYLGGLMEKYDKEGGICETGCPTIFGEGRQARWIRESTRGMLRAIAASPQKDRFRFAVFYELVDSPSGLVWPPPSEASFGLLAADGRRKPGFAAFEKMVLETDAAQRALLEPAASRN